jgi:hypothetical protein
VAHNGNISNATNLPRWLSPGLGARPKYPAPHRQQRSR